MIYIKLRKSGTVIHVTTSQRPIYSWKQWIFIMWPFLVATAPCSSRSARRLQRWCISLGFCVEANKRRCRQGCQYNTQRRSTMESQEPGWPCGILATYGTRWTNWERISKPMPAHNWIYAVCIEVSAISPMLWCDIQMKTASRELVARVIRFRRRQ